MGTRVLGLGLESQSCWTWVPHILTRTRLETCRTRLELLDSANLAKLCRWRFDLCLPNQQCWNTWKRNGDRPTIYGERPTVYSTQLCYVLLRYFLKLVITVEDPLCYRAVKFPLLGTRIRTRATNPWTQTRNLLDSDLTWDMQDTGLKKTWTRCNAEQNIYW